MNKEKCVCLISKRFGLTCLVSILQSIGNANIEVITFDDLHDGRSEYSQITSFCTSNHIPCHIVNTTNILKETLHQIRPKIVFVAGWYKILTQDILNIPEQGIIGIHFSLLPKYRGGAPVVWSIINGEKKAGFSLFKFDSGVDNGPIYDQQSVQIKDDDYIDDVLCKIEKLAAESLRKNFKKIYQGSISPQPQVGTPTYAAQRIEEDGRINWNFSQEKIFNFIRAQSHPYPGAYTYIENSKIYIYKAKKISDTYYCTPGQVVSCKNRVLIGTGDHKVLEILETYPNNIEKIFTSIHLRCL